VLEELLSAPGKETPAELRERALWKRSTDAASGHPRRFPSTSRTWTLSCAKCASGAKGTRREWCGGDYASEALSDYLTRRHELLSDGKPTEALFLNARGGRLTARGLALLLRSTSGRLKPGSSSRLTPSGTATPRTSWTMAPICGPFRSARARESGYNRTVHPRDAWPPPESPLVGASPRAEADPP